MVRIQVVIEKRSFAYIKIVLNKITVAFIFQIMHGVKFLQYRWNGNIILLLVAELLLVIPGRTIIPGSGGKEEKRRKSSVFGIGFILFLMQFMELTVHSK